MSATTSRIPYLRVIRSPGSVTLWLGQIVSSLGDTLTHVTLCHTALAHVGRVRAGTRARGML